MRGVCLETDMGLSRCNAKSVRLELQKDAMQNDTIPPSESWSNSAQQTNLFQVQVGVCWMKPISQFHTAMATAYGF